MIQRASSKERGRIVHPLFVRITHWINAFAAIAMLMSGMRIYNASPLYEFRFPPEMTLGGWLGGGLLWHFAAMWVLVINGVLYVILGFTTGRFRRNWSSYARSCRPTSSFGSGVPAPAVMRRSRECSGSPIWRQASRP